MLVGFVPMRCSVAAVLHAGWRSGVALLVVPAAASLLPGVADADTNLIGNPGFESGTLGWNTSGGDAGVTLTQVAGGHSGDYAVAVNNTTSSVATCMLNDSPNWVRTTSAGAYAASLWVRSDASLASGASARSALSLYLREYSRSGALLSRRESSVSLTTSWQQVSVTLPVASPGSTLDFKAEVSRWGAAPGPGTCFYADDVSLVHVPPGPPPAPTVTLNPSSGVAPLPVTVNATDAGGFTPGTLPIASYTFDFGDGTPAVGPQAGASATHTYSLPGTYTVTTTVTDTAGSASTATQPVTAFPNLVTNPGFESGTQGWNGGASSPGVTLTQVSDAHTGNGAALLANTSTTTATCGLNDSPNSVQRTTAGGYTATLWVRADNPGATLKLRLREWAGTTLVGQAKTPVTLTTQWQPVTVEYTPVDPGSSTLDLNAYVMNAAVGTCFYADDASIQQNVSLVKNGDFESPAISQVSVTFGPPGFDGWTVDQGSVDIVGSDWPAASGRQSLDLSGIQAGSIAQVIPTDPGKAYSLRFSYAGNPDRSSNPGCSDSPVKTMQLLWAGAVVGSYSFDTTGSTFANPGWRQAEVSVIATSSSSELRFTSLTPGDCGIALDDVSLVPAAA